MITVEEPKKIKKYEDKYHSVFKSYDSSCRYAFYFWNYENYEMLKSTEFDTRPFNPKVITYENLTYNLHNPLKCLVTYEDDNFIIRNDLLDITVWGEDQDIAEEAFYFMFNAVYENYANEKEEYLSEKAIILKHKIDNLIASIN